MSSVLFSCVDKVDIITFKCDFFVGKKIYGKNIKFMNYWTDNATAIYEKTMGSYLITIY